MEGEKDPKIAFLNPRKPLSTSRFHETVPTDILS